MFEYFIVSDPELEKTNYQNPFLNATKYTTQFSEEQLRNEMIELNGLNHTNLKTMISAIEKEKNVTTLQKFLANSNVYPVVKLKQIRIDDKLDAAGSLTINHKQYFEEVLKLREGPVDKLTDKHLSCAALHDTVKDELLKLSEKTKEFVHGKEYTQLAYQLVEEDFNIDIEEDMSVAIIDYSVRSSKSSKKEKKKKKKTTIESLDPPRFKFLKLQPEKNTQKIAITGFVVINAKEVDYYTVIDEMVGGGDHHKKNKCKSSGVQTITINKDYNEENEVRTKNFLKENTYYKLSDISIEEAIEKILPVETISTSLAALNTTSFNINDYIDKDECSNKAVFDFGKAEIKTSKREKKGIVQDIEAAGKVDRIYDLKQDNNSKAVPKLPRDFFNTKIKFNDVAILKDEFEKWEIDKINELEQKQNTPTNTLSINTDMIKVVTSYFNKIHEIKYRSELKKEFKYNNTTILNEYYSKEDPSRIFQNTTREQKQKINNAIDQFESFKNSEQTFEGLKDELVKLIRLLIRSVGFQSLDLSNARTMYQLFVQSNNPRHKIGKLHERFLKKHTEYTSNDRILGLAALYMMYSQLENKRFIVKQGFDKFYDHRSWPLWEKNADNDPSSILYIAHVIVDGPLGENMSLSSMKSVKKVYEMIMFYVIFYLRYNDNLRQTVEKQKKDNMKDFDNTIVNERHDDNASSVNDLEFYENNSMRKIPKPATANKIFSSRTKDALIANNSQLGPHKYIKEVSSDEKSKGELEFMSVLQKVLRENGLKHEVKERFKAIFSKHVDELKVKLMERMERVKVKEYLDKIIDIEKSTDVIYSSKFVQKNFHNKDLVIKLNRDYDFIKKIHFKTETLFASSISITDKMKVKLFCIVLQLLNLLDTNTFVEEKNKLYVEHLKGVFDNLGVAKVDEYERGSEVENILAQDSYEEDSDDEDSEQEFTDDEDDN